MGAPLLQEAARRLSSPTPGIDLCRVSIPCLLATVCPGVSSRDYARLPHIPPGRFRPGGIPLTPGEQAQAARFKTLKRQLEWMGGRLAIKMLAAAAFPSRRPVSVMTDDRGAPYLEDDPGISVSISHSHAWAVAGLSRDKDLRIGLDLERITSVDMEAVKRAAFTARETRDMDSTLEWLFRSWTAKEAFLKLIGQGFHESLKQVEVIGGKIFYRRSPMCHVRLKSRRFREGYLLTVVWSKGV